MSKQSSCTRCKQCKQEVLEDLREHWEENHPVELEAIDRWLERHRDKAREWERVVKKQEKGEEND